MQLLDRLFDEFKLHGEYLIREELLTSTDIDDYKSNKVGSRIISIGVPAYCILEVLLHSAKANSDGLLLSKSLIIYLPYVKSPYTCIIIKYGVYLFYIYILRYLYLHFR